MLRKEEREGSCRTLKAELLVAAQGGSKTDFQAYEGQAYGEILPSSNQPLSNYLAYLSSCICISIVVRAPLYGVQLCSTAK